MHRAACSTPSPAELHDHVDWRPEWTPSRRCLYWYLTVRTAELEAAVPRRLTDLVERTPWLDRVPPDWWHVTLCDVGFVDDLPGETVDRVLDAARSAVPDTGTVPLRLGPLAAFPSAIALAVHPLAELRELQGRLRAATQGAVGPHAPLVHRHLFWPHLSLGYVNRAVPAGEVATLLDDPAAAAQDLAATADRLVLASVERHGRTYRWSTVAERSLRAREVVS